MDPNSNEWINSEKSDFSNGLNNVAHRRPINMTSPSTSLAPMAFFVSGPPPAHQQWRESYSYNGPNSLMISSNSSTSYGVMTDSRRIQGMENTIQLLQELLSKEINNSSKEKLKSDELEKLLQSSMKANKDLEEKTKAALDERDLGQEEVKAALEEVKAAHEEVAEAQKDLQTARKEIDELKCLKYLQEAKIEQLTKDAEIKLSVNEPAVDADPIQLNNQLIAAVGVKNFLAKQFKELARKNLLMLSYSEEQFYANLRLKHTEFIKTLTELSANTENQKKCALIKQTLDCVQEQHKMLEDLSEDFELTIKILTSRVDLGLALVSDLNIRAPRPKFEIPVDNFATMLQLISHVGSVEPKASD